MRSGSTTRLASCSSSPTRGGSSISTRLSERELAYWRTPAISLLGCRAMRRLSTLLATVAVALGVSSPAQAVVGGNDAAPGEYPYIAHIVIDRSFQCTGTLVTPRYVVTAAHCGSLAPGGIANVPIGQPGQLIELSIGAYKTPSASLAGGYESDGEKHVASAVFVNPGWAGLGSVSHDAA